MISRLMVFLVNQRTGELGKEIRDVDTPIRTDEPINFDQPPAMPEDLYPLFTKLAANKTPARLITFDKPDDNAPKGSNGWSMCQVAAPVRRRAYFGARETLAVLVPL